MDENSPKDAGLVAEWRTLGRRPERGCVKRYCKGLVVDEGVVRDAYEEWLSHGSGKRNSWRVPKDYGSPDALVSEIAREVRERSLSFVPIRRHEAIEPTNGKIRLIGVESVKQQVVDYVVVMCCEDMLRAKVGYWQVAGVPGKGCLFAANAVRRWVSDGSSRYFAKSDITKCYPSTNAGMVRDIVARYVASPDVLYCLDSVLSTYDGGGLEIGSYLSSRLMGLVLSFAYHHVESLSKTRRGRSVPLVTHQVWQMDDMVLFSRSKSDLARAMRSLERFMGEELGLSMKPWKVCRVGDDEPVDICGFRIRTSHVELRDGTFLRARRAFARFDRRLDVESARRVTSYYGLLSHSDARGLMRRLHMDRTAARARRLISEESRKHGT